MPPDFAQAGGVAVTLEDLALAVKIGPGQALLNELLLRRLAAARAAQEGLAVPEDELDEAVGEFFAEADAFEEPQILAWLRSRNLTLEAVRAWVRETRLGQRVRERLVPDEAVEKRFHGSLHDYTRISAEVIEFESAGVASEVLLQLREQETAWPKAVEQAGGMESVDVLRSEAPEEAAALLFSAAPGTLVGPVETDEGNHAIYRVLSKADPELDEDLQEQIRGELFTQEILRPLAKQPLTFQP
jgi:parvulin-like peptidyl-prolyl isomerase